jgi:KDO2-lipid IV(A) lauroyltransferase
MRQPTVQDRIEAWFLRGIAALSRALPLDASSNLGGFLGRRLGPLMGASKRARRNLAKAFPDWTPRQIDATVAEMWANLGRNVFEYEHLDALFPYGPSSRVEIEGDDIIADLIAQGRPLIFFSGHIGNWELMPMAIRWNPHYGDAGEKMCQIYRALNNPLADAQLLAIRKRHQTPNSFPKGTEGARAMIAFLKKGGAVALLIDQKMNDGIPVPFFGRDAMTAPAAAQMALRYGAILAPVSNVRLGGAHFRVRFHPPLEVTATGDKNADAAAIMRQCNGFLEEQIRQNPAQWFWVHRRWPD